MGEDGRCEAGTLSEPQRIQEKSVSLLCCVLLKVENSESIGDNEKSGEGRLAWISDCVLLYFERTLEGHRTRRREGQQRVEDFVRRFVS